MSERIEESDLACDGALYMLPGRLCHTLDLRPAPGRGSQRNAYVGNRQKAPSRKNGRRIQCSASDEAAHRNAPSEVFVTSDSQLKIAQRRWRSSHPERTLPGHVEPHGHSHKNWNCFNDARLNAIRWN